MRASPACQVSLRRFGVWRAGVAAVGLLAVAVVGAWCIRAPASISTTLMTFSVLLSLACVAVAASLWRVPAVSLHWDGLRWHLDATPGTLQVAIDLGPWMLLWFNPEGRARRRWLPVQRRGLESQWHALRCAVYAGAPGCPR